jgi:hypothetical protein
MERRKERRAAAKAARASNDTVNMPELLNMNIARGSQIKTV